MKHTTIFSDFLEALGVPHTRGASDAAFETMSFKTLFGFSRLLNSYGIATRALRLTDKSQLQSVPVPFVAKLDSGFAIVEQLTASSVEFRTRTQRRILPVEDFDKIWTGVILQAFPDEMSAEPDYRQHRFCEIAKTVKVWVLVAAVLFAGVFGFYKAGLWRHVSTVLLTLVNLAGLGVTWLLVLKSLKVNSKSADRICGIMKEHGCDTVLEQKASKFFGLFGWSEVGLSYFGVSTLTMILFPWMLPDLALVNACCLPFTLWSIWYQHFRLHTWCTLCVTTQCLLWLQFFCYLGGGLWHGLWPIGLPIFVLGAVYVAVVLSLNRIMEFIERAQKS